MSNHGAHRDHPTDAPAKPTDPLRDDGPGLPPHDAVTALLVVGRGDEPLALSPRKQDFKVGSALPPEVDVSIRSRRADGLEHVSRVHVILYRRHNRFWIVDQRSTAGLYIDDRPEIAADRRAGQSFRIGDVTLLCLDDALGLLRPVLHWYLGLDAFDLVHRTLEKVGDGRLEPLLIIAPPGSEPEGLAKAIHAAAANRAHPFLAFDPELARGRAEQTAFLAVAGRATLLVDLDRISNPPAHLVAELFGSTYPVRPIFTARSLEAAAESLTERYYVRVQAHVIPPLAQRRADVPRLFETITSHRAGPFQLDRDSAAALAAYDWSGHVAEMRKVEPAVRAYLEHGRSYRTAARVLGHKSHGSLARLLAKLGLRDARRETRLFDDENVDAGK